MINPNDSACPARAALVNHDAVRADLAALAETGRPVDYRAAFGPTGQGIATYLILDDQRRVDLLQVAWLG